MPGLTSSFRLARGVGGPGGRAHVSRTWSEGTDVKLPKTQGHARVIADLRQAAPRCGRA
jgi:hypothetical protein